VSLKDVRLDLPEDGRNWRIFQLFRLFRFDGHLGIIFIAACSIGFPILMIGELGNEIYEDEPVANSGLSCKWLRYSQLKPLSEMTTRSE
jgi:hypothetical protein